MAASKVRVKVNPAGAIALLRDSGVQADLVARGDRMAAAAGPGFEVRPAQGRDRGVVFVTAATDEARKAEAETRALTRAIDAGR